MDLHTIHTIEPRPTRATLAEWKPGDAWLAGGSWLFSEPQPQLTRLFDLQGFGWPDLTATAAGLEIAATCPIATLRRWDGAPAEWRAAALFEPAAQALVGSFKVWNVATVGGNMCLALPAGPMTALCAALDGECLVWTPEGAERRVPALDFVRGDRLNALRPGEVLRAIHLPAATLRRRAALRQASLSPLGRSGALLIGTRDRGSVALTVTAATKRPFRLAVSPSMSPGDMAAVIDAAIPADAWHDDVHGRPDWRRHVAAVLAGEIVAELAAGTRA